MTALSDFQSSQILGVIMVAELFGVSRDTLHEVMTSFWENG